MEDFKRNRAAAVQEQGSEQKSASEVRAEISHQEQSAQQNEGENSQNYNYDEYDSYSPWG